MGCNCKERANIDLLIKNVNKTNKENSTTIKKNSVGDNILVYFMKIIVYLIMLLLVVPMVIYIMLRVVLTKKQVKINSLFKNVRKQ